ncbi:MAG: leader peptide processing enzyme [Treponema sp.]|nr:leader peptide processing enzyme [Treponema sp.]
MNKKVNTLFFILGATAFNILIAVISFLLLTILYARFLMDRIPESGRSWGFALIFISSIAISFMVYRAVLKFLLTKIDIEKYFDPIFTRKNIKK